MSGANAPERGGVGIRTRSLRLDCISFYTVVRLPPTSDPLGIRGARQMAARYGHSSGGSSRFSWRASEWPTFLHLGTSQWGPMKRGSELTPKGAKILAALERFRDVIEAGTPIEQRYTVRQVKLDLTRRTFGPDEVKGIRAMIGVSQPIFGQFLGVDVKTVRSWEQGRRTPLGDGLQIPRRDPNLSRSLAKPPRRRVGRIGPGSEGNWFGGKLGLLLGGGDGVKRRRHIAADDDGSLGVVIPRHRTSYRKR